MRSTTAPLLFLSSLLLTMQCLADPNDCETAASACRANCKSAPIYDTDRGDYLKQSDFAKRCERSCAQGLNACGQQDTKNACTTFFYHCTSSCPWKVIDTNLDLTIHNSDSFAQCGGACRSGQKSCDGVSAKLPPRKRTKDFDACEEAQGACYTTCMSSPDNDESFPDECAKACFDGVKVCKAASVAKKCGSFDKDCGIECLGLGGIESEHDLARFGKCSDSCKAGTKNCESILTP